MLNYLPISLAFKDVTATVMQIGLASNNLKMPSLLIGAGLRIYGTKGFALTGGGMLSFLPTKAEPLPNSTPKSLDELRDLIKNEFRFGTYLMFQLMY